MPQQPDEATICPCCRRPIDSLGTLVCLDTNRLSYRGRDVHLTPREAEVLSALAAASPRVVSRERLNALVYGMGSREYVEGSKCLDVRMVAIRRKLAGISLCVETVRERGYRLVEGEQAS